MLKQFMNSGSLNALMVHEAEGATKTPVELAREAIAKNTQSRTADGDKEPEKEEVEKEVEKEEENEEEGEEEDEDGEKEEEEVEETDEEKAAREAREKAEAKAQRKDARIQRRIDTAVAAQRKAETELAELKATIDANPDKKLTEAEVQTRAEAIAADKLAQANLERLQKEFNANCDRLQEAATKADKLFTPKVVEMTNDLGPIPSRIIGILADLDNGPDVLRLMVDDIDEAEKLYDLKDRPEKLAIAIVRLADKLAEANKPKPKKLSKVPAQGDPIKPKGNVQSNVITGKESTEDYIAKRTAQREQQRKIRGY
jgi:hypothetical protein